MATPDDVTAAPESGSLTSSDAMSHGRFAPGAMLSNRYRMVGLLGRGGMGEVYRADDLKLGQTVALKFLPESLAQDPARLAQFHGEVRLARQISHPNVCRVYDIGEVDGHPFLTMEYVDGEDLASLLRRIGRLPEDKAVETARQFCAGVAAAHDRGVLHRDLKPANIMIDGRGHARVMDFGLAAASGTSVDIRSGTPAYMAPEQLAGRGVSVSSDVYAIGLVLFELFTGRRAFEAANLTELLRLHQEGHLTPPTRLVPSLDPAIERAILRCLEPDPSARPVSALAVAAALPGGDPLAAALAAGETPSPAMVAAAGHVNALPRPVALATLGVIAAVLAVLPLIFDRVLLLRAIAPPKPPEVLLDRAQAIRQMLGYTDLPRDEHYEIDSDDDYLNYIERFDPTRERWARLRTGRAAAMQFWYRSSPRPLERLGPALAPTIADPPLTLSGMTTLSTDLQGRLVSFDAVPVQREDNTTPPPAPDWSGLFAAAQLPMSSFTPVAPMWTPPAYADTRAAWEGTLPEDGATRVRIEAAAYRGRPVFFQIVGPWTRAPRMELPADTDVDGILGTVLVMVLIVGAALAARHNLRRGRGDRRGGDRVFIGILALFVVQWAFGAHHFDDIVAEINAALLFLAVAVLVAGVVWLFYLALEPLVRRWQPRALVGWTRLLNGTVRDPQVGRDVLAGVLAGALFELIRAPRSMTALLAGAPASAPLDSSYAPLMGIASTITLLAQLAPNAITNGMMLILIFALLRLMFRRTSIAAAVTGALLLAVVALQLQSTPAGWTQWPVALVAVVLVFTVAIRFGLLATVVMFYIANVLEFVPLTADPSMRYFATSMWTLAGVATLAFFAAHAARAGQPLFSSAGPKAVRRERA